MLRGSAKTSTGKGSFSAAKILLLVNIYDTPPSVYELFEGSYHILSIFLSPGPVMVPIMEERHNQSWLH